MERHKFSKKFLDPRNFEISDTRDEKLQKFFLYWFFNSLNVNNNY